MNKYLSLTEDFILNSKFTQPFIKSYQHHQKARKIITSFLSLTMADSDSEAFESADEEVEDKKPKKGN
jgi:hypothetical protein